MGIQQFRLPDVGEGLVEAEIVSWKVKPGDTVKLNDTVVEIETAKSLVELPVPFAGVVTELLVPEGETVPVGTPIISVQTESSEASPEDLVPTIPEPEETGGRTAVLVGYGPKTTEAKRRQRKPAASPGPAPAPVVAAVPTAPPAPVPVAVPAPAPVAGGNGSVHVLAKPPVRKLAKDLGIEAKVAPISVEDVLGADELFFTGTAVEVTAIREVDGREMSGGKPGPITRRIQETFNQAVRGQLPQYRRWLSFVRQPVASRS